MANEQNLKKLSTSEAREIGRKGGVKSGETRRRKRDMKQAMNILMSLPVSETNKNKLEQIGLDESEATNQMLMLTVVLNKALKGDMKAVEYITSLTALNASEQAKLKNEKLKLKSENTSNPQIKSNPYKDLTTEELKKLINDD